MKLFRLCALAALVCLSDTASSLSARAPVKLVRATPAPPATPTPVAKPVALRPPAALPASPRALLPLAERCVVAVFGRYTYEVCPFSNISQKDTAYHYLLGLWSGWQEEANGEAMGARMSFSDGCACGSKRRRAMLTLTCGKALAVLDVAEAPTCEYSLTLSSPEACMREEEAAAATAAVAVVEHAPPPERAVAVTERAAPAEGEGAPPPSAAICTGPPSAAAATRALCEEVAALRRALVGLAAVVVEQSAPAPPALAVTGASARAGADADAPPPAAASIESTQESAVAVAATAEPVSNYGADGIAVTQAPPDDANGGGGSALLAPDAPALAPAEEEWAAAELEFSALPEHATEHQPAQSEPIAEMEPISEPPMDEAELEPEPEHADEPAPEEPSEYEEDPPATENV